MWHLVILPPSLELWLCVAHLQKISMMSSVTLVITYLFCAIYLIILGNPKSGTVQPDLRTSLAAAYTHNGKWQLFFFFLLFCLWVLTETALDAAPQENCPSSLCKGLKCQTNYAFQLVNELIRDETVTVMNMKPYQSCLIPAFCWTVCLVNSLASPTAAKYLYFLLFFLLLCWASITKHEKLQNN